MKIHEILSESIIFRRLNKVPQQFKANIQNLINRDSEILHEEDPDNQVITGDRDVVVEFGANSGTPPDNTVYVGNKFFSKDAQYRKFKHKVNTIKTYGEVLADMVEQGFIAKQKTGSRQEGQLINEVPEDSEDYIFQKLVKIVKEFRVVTYYMNGKYHVSGIYEKTGSNTSFKSIPVSGEAGKKLSAIAKKATRLLGYGVGGVDIALVDPEYAQDIVFSESVRGRVVSKAMKFVGKMSDIELDRGYLVVLEVNSFPSMTNLGIFQDTIDDIKSRIVNK